jgi:hypothetical protein
VVIPRHPPRIENYPYLRAGIPRKKHNPFPFSLFSSNCDRKTPSRFLPGQDPRSKGREIQVEWGSEKLDPVRRNLYKAMNFASFKIALAALLARPGCDAERSPRFP